MTDDYWLIPLGFLGQAMFGARTVAQWIIAERQGRIVSPVIFWVFSVIGSSVFLLYGIFRQDAVIIVGQSISFYIYLRNLHLKGVWKKIPVYLRIPMLFIPPVMLLFSNPLSFSFRFDDTFLIVGMVGQLLLNFRYFYQWYFSERAHESILPLGFWIISATASVMVVTYSIYRDDIVLLVAQSLGLIAYARNIYLHFRSNSVTVEHPKTR
ncbi:MAG TPA: lipid-A-disaccharide synthase N-terminal domain-containing protein [Cyclobacteriaceae bacterium]|nr:lipid-A-disaccharide synthase N-terminal domain-containing protein [Cyclobacteriaceae bacterium]